MILKVKHQNNYYLNGIMKKITKLLTSIRFEIEVRCIGYVQNVNMISSKIGTLKFMKELLTIADAQHVEI